MRTRKETVQARGAYSLESAKRGVTQDRGKNEREDTHELDNKDGVTSQDRKGKGVTDRHSLPGDCRRKEVGTRKETERERGTHSLERRIGLQVRAGNETERARSTHTLESAGREQVTIGKETERPGNTHALKNIDRKTKLRQEKNMSNIGTLTNWRVQTKGQVRKMNETN